MSFDTTELNKTRHDLSGRADVWLFGYGSLIFKADFPFLERRPASIEGWARRFWQGAARRSGRRDYLLHLAETRRELGAEEEHVFGLEGGFLP